MEPDGIWYAWNRYWLMISTTMAAQRKDFIQSMIWFVCFCFSMRASFFLFL